MIACGSMDKSSYKLRHRIYTIYNFYRPVLLQGGGGRFCPPSDCLRDAAEPRNLVTFLKFNGQKDFKYGNDKFQPESRDMAIFGRSPCQKVVKLHLYCHNV